MSEVLEVTPRELRGKLNNRRLRDSGKLPAVLYGHGEKSVSLTLEADQFDASLRHGAKVVELKGAAKGQALMQEIQWDTFQQHVLHVDLLRVDASEKITVEVEVVLRGQAPGENEGGVVQQLLHAIEIETTAAHIPEQLHVSVNDLHMDGSLNASDIEDLPSGAKVLDESATIVQCVEPTVAPEEEETAETGAEPEVIGRAEDEEESAAE